MKKDINEKANTIITWSNADLCDYLNGIDTKPYTINEVIKVTSAGDGNMNFTLRVCTDKGSLIVKQSPPYCAKFEHIPAPCERILAEAKFYELTGSIKPNHALKNTFPEIYHLDDKQNIMVMQDFGESKDYEWVYSQNEKQISENEIISLFKILNELHQPKFKPEKFINQSMRKLNHEYIFVLPFTDQSNAINLDSITQGLSKIGLKFSKDKALVNAARELGQCYLNQGDTLLHGDFYPRSWLKTQDGIKIIDPEFGFVGLAEFELGVMFAHLALSSQLKQVWQPFKTHYVNVYSDTLLAKFTGIEILRRLLYVSQLPVKNCLNTKQQWLEYSRELVVTGNKDLLHKFM